ncbi:hypothetical protein R69749_06380 [Paraburkholderia domus]|nr:hypothetical protein R75483_05858 [Paraburkholderia domus]CAE6873019.1 hypothetical protein R69749_06380 [Paraburkholderia domus]
MGALKEDAARLELSWNIGRDARGSRTNSETGHPNLATIPWVIAAKLAKALWGRAPQAPLARLCNEQATANKISEDLWS